MNWRQVAEQTPGWLFPEEAEALHRWAAQAAATLVEIGSFAGKSTVCIASAAKHPVVSIDPHRGNPEMQPGGDCFIPEAWDEHTEQIDSSVLLRRTLHKADLERKVSVICDYSTHVSRWWRSPVGFLFIDGDHGPRVRDDYSQWSKWLTDDAILAFHDTDIPAVAQAVTDAKGHGWVEQEAVRDCLRVFTR